MEKWTLKNMNVVRVVHTKGEANGLIAKGFKLVLHEPAEDYEPAALATLDEVVDEGEDDTPDPTEDGGGADDSSEGKKWGRGKNRNK